MKSLPWICSVLLIACGGRTGPGIADAVPDASCGDLDDDPHNCGRCGNDCMGTACSAGVCEPIVLAVESSVVGNIVVDDTSVYWVSGFTSIRACTKTGCGQNPTTLASNQANASGLAADDDTLYWTNTNAEGMGGAGVFECAKTGCSTATALWVGAASSVTAVDSTNVYWSNASGVMTCSKSGCTTPNLLAPSPFALLAIDDASLFVASNLGLYRCPKSGCGPQPAQVFGNFPYALSLDASDVYFMDDAGELVTCPKAGCGATTLATGVATTPYVGGIAVDDRNVYWVEFGTPPQKDSILTCPKLGCDAQPTVLADDLEWPSSIAVDDTSVYFTAQSDQQGLVLKVPKPWQP